MVAGPGFGIGASEFLFLFLFFGNGFGLPMGIPPEKEDELLQRIAPEECLFYTSWAGMAEADAKSANATERMFADPEFKRLVAGIEKLIEVSTNKLEQEEGSEAAKAARDAWRWGRLAATRPACIFVESFTPGPRPKTKGAIVIQVGAEANAVRDALDHYEQLLARSFQTKIEDVTIDTGSFRRAKLHPDSPSITWGVVRNYFMIGVGEGSIEGVMQRAKLKSTPKWLTDIQTMLPVERRATVAYMNVEGIKTVATPGLGLQGHKVLSDIGLDNVKSLIAVTGLDEKAFVAKTLVNLEGQPKGVLQLLAAKPLTAADLAAIPADSTFAGAARFDADQSIDLFLEIVGSIDPRTKQAFQSGLSMADEELGLKIRADLLASLGDVWRVYSSPADGGWIFPGITLVVDVREPDRLEAALRKLVRLASEDGEVIHRTVRHAGADLHVLQGKRPFEPFAFFSPTYTIHDGKLILALSPNAVKGYLGRGENFKSLADVPEVAAAIAPGKGGAMVGYQDTRELVRIFYPLLTFFAQGFSSEASRAGFDLDVSIIPSAQALTRHMRPGVTTIVTTPHGIEFTARQTLPSFNPGTVIPIGAGLSIPVIAAAREAAQRNMATNQFKQILLACHNYLDANRTFPPAFTSKDGKQLLSWRVHLLPYLEQQALYEQFHLDEPWDSEHNKTLIEKMPQIYANANLTLPKGKTAFAGVRRPDAVFTGDKGVQIQEITDGTSNTIMLVEIDAAKAVVWTKPDDYTPDDKDPAGGMHVRQGNVSLAGFADGHVSAMSRRLRTESWKAFFTRNGGEVVSENDLGPQPRGVFQDAAPDRIERAAPEARPDLPPPLEKKPARKE